MSSSDLPSAQEQSRGWPPAEGARWRKATLATLGVGWLLFLAYNAYQSTLVFASGFGTAPAYGDTGEYWASAETLRVDEVRTWTYAALLRFAPGDVGSETTIRFVQTVQMALALAASAYFGSCVARSLGWSGARLRVAVASSAVLAGASLISVHMAHSILQDSLAASGFIALMGALMLLQSRDNLGASWWLAAMPAGVLVATLRWERLLVAIPVIGLAVLAVALKQRPLGRDLVKRKATWGIGLAVLMAISFALTKFTRKIEGRDLPAADEVGSRFLDQSARVAKVFLESMLSPISSVTATDTSDVIAGSDAVQWTNSRIVDHIGYWPSFLWLVSGYVVALALLVALFLGLPRLLGGGQGGWVVWGILALAVAGAAIIHTLTYRSFHPRYCLPITGIELTLATTMVLMLAQSMLRSGGSKGQPTVVAAPGDRPHMPGASEYRRHGDDHPSDLRSSG